MAKAALERTESRGGHTREDFPAMDPQWRGVNLVCRLRPVDGAGHADPPAGARRSGRDLLELFERKELGKYLTPRTSSRCSTTAVRAERGEQA